MSAARTSSQPSSSRSRLAVTLQGGRLLGEDFGFCGCWRRIGGKVWLGPTTEIRHHDTHAFVGDPTSLFAPAPTGAAAEAA